MKPIFHHRPVNGPFEDPGLYVRILRERVGLLFDAGDISKLTVRELLKLAGVFITHTHIDHFIGFDTILRALLKRRNPVTFYGPEGIIDCINGKLRGYNWNLIAEYPLVVHVVEAGEGGIRRAYFTANTGFERTDIGAAETLPTILDNELFSVNALILKHDIPSLGFSIEEKMHINIDKARLNIRGFTVGPWLNGLKKAIRNKNPEEIIDTGNGEYGALDLRDIYTITEGQKVAYVMDSAPEDRNIEKIVEFVRGADSLYIEAYFLHEDIERARRRHHLTARIAGIIARDAGVKNLHLMHFSPRYRENPERLVKEAVEEFRR